MNKTIACPKGHPVQVPALPGRTFSGGVSVVTRSAEDEFLDCTLCGPFRQDGRGNAESIIDQIANREFHHELVAASRVVIEALTIDGETDVDTIVARTGIDEDMVRIVLGNRDVFETSTFVDAPSMIAAAKLTPYGTTLARIARNERTRRVPKKVPCPRCRKEHTILVIDEPPPSEKTSVSVGPVICNGCCGFTVDDYGRVYP